MSATQYITLNLGGQYVFRGGDTQKSKEANTILLKPAVKLLLELFQIYQNRQEKAFKEPTFCCKQYQTFSLL